MPTLQASGPQFLSNLDTALSDTARELREKLQSAIDPPGTARQVRRAEMKKILRDDAVVFATQSDDLGVIRRMLASMLWSETFIDAALSTIPTPDIAVDTDGEVLFEWLSGPRDVVTISVGPGGVINFASLAGSDRFHGVTRVGERVPGPLWSCLAQIKAVSAA